MLVLTRKLDEVICIGDDITIKVVRLGPDTVKLGIEAPKHVVVMRKELLPDDKMDLKAVQPKLGVEQ